MSKCLATHTEEKVNKSGRPPKFNISQHEEIIRFYTIEKLTTQKIGQIFDSSPETIANVLRRNGIILRKRSESNKLSTKFTFTEMTEEKAFLLGLIYGDGSISIRQDYINLTSGDLDLLEKSRDILGNKFKIYKIENSNCYRGVIHSHKLCEELFTLFGLINNKSDKLIWPNLKPNLIPFFISGYLATDGCISISRELRISLSFYSCSKEYLKNLSFHLCNQINVPLQTIYLRKPDKGHLGKKPLYLLGFYGIKAKKIGEYIFQNTTPKTRSDRKFGIFDYYNQTILGNRTKFAIQNGHNSI
jgi:hypothetical protein